MDKLSWLAFLAGTLGTSFTSLLYIWYAFGLRRQLAASTAGGRGTVTTSLTAPDEVGGYANLLGIFSFVALTISLIARTIATGHGPFANMFEFAVSFSWGIVGCFLFFERRYGARALGAFVLPVATGILCYASSIPPDIQPLVPALQNNLLLSVHVAVAILAYGTFTTAFGAAILYLLQTRNRPLAWLPAAETLDDLGYRAVIIGFPFMALVIILGAIWADVAWGTYWSWDPKETASLVTWLIYGGYLHARTVQGWRGARSAVLLLLGFVATIFTYFGNLWFGGLHSYAGV